VKLRGKILLAFLVAALPLAAIDVWWIVRGRRAERAQVLDRLRSDAEHASAHLRLFFRDLAARGQETAREALRAEGLEAYLRGRLAELRQWNAGVKGLAWVGADGRLIAGLPADFVAPGASVAAEASFQALGGRQAWALGDLEFRQVDGRPVALVRMLARDADGRFRGAVMIGLGPEFVQPLFPSSTSRVAIRLADRTGRLVYATDLGEPAGEERQGWADLAGVRDALRGGRATDPELRLPGARQATEGMAAHIIIPETGWVASAVISLPDATATSRQALRKELASHGFLVALCVGVALILAHRVASPARRLAGAAHRIAGGDRAARVGLTGRDELAAAGRAFDRMAEAVDASWQALTAQRDAAEEMAARLAALTRLANLVSSTLNPGQVFEFVAEATSRLLEGAAALLLVADETGENLTICASHGLGHPELRTQDRFRAGEGLAGWVFQRREALVVTDMVADPRTLNRAWIETAGLRAFAGVPLLAHDRCVGVLCAMRGGEEALGQSHVDLLAAFAAHAATAIQNARLYEQVKVEGERFRALLDAMPEGILVGEGEPGGKAIRLVMANRARVELMQTPALVLGARTPHYELIRPDGTPLDDAELPLQRAIWRGEATRGQELAVRFPDPSQRYILVNAVPLPEVAGTRRAVVVLQDITGRKRAEEELRRLAEEVAALYEQAARDAQMKGLLLEEVTHRVRNNLALIVSFLELQREGVNEADVGGVVEDAIARVEGLALVHKVLAGANFQAGEFGALARGLAEQTLQQGSMAGRVTVRVEGPALLLPSTQLTTLGLITNELFTNIAKHAFPDGRTGTVEVTVESAGPEATVRVADDGVGLPPGFAEQPGHLGLKLIRSMAELTLRGTFTLESAKGTTAAICFPVPDAAPPAR